MSKIFALVDCNNFYASCERLFRPELKNRPIAVLSNNDGCIIARSNELKNLGIHMGAPYFQFKKQLEEINAAVFSSNYSLYGDMSNRVMHTLKEFSDDLEIYSIDEAFLDITGFKTNRLTELGHQIKQTIVRHTGIPVSVGIAPTKTLAKIANEVAKKDNRHNLNKYNGVVNLCDFTTDINLETGEGSTQLDQILHQTPIGDVWGIGRQYTKKLNQIGLHTALDLQRQNPTKIKKISNINLAKTVLELRAKSCIELEYLDEPKSVVSTRSYTIPLKSHEQLQAVIATYTSRVAEKLRQKNCLASNIMVFVHTNRFKTEVYFNSHSKLLNNPTNFTPELINSALECLNSVYKPGLEYKKAGVGVWGIIPARQIITPLFQDLHTQQLPRQKQLMQAVDKINLKYGRYTLKAAITNLKLANFEYDRQEKPQHYTTVWSDILKIQI